MKEDWQKDAEEVLIRYCGTFSPLLIASAKGSYVYTEDGRAILDFTSGQMCSVFGHNHPDILAAMEQAGTRAIHLLSTMLSPELIALGKTLSGLLPEGLDRSIFLNTGSESNEVALRMAKLHTGGFEIVGFAGSWHGMTAGAQSHTYSLTRRGYGPAMPGSLMLPAPYAYRCPIQHCQGTCDNSCLEFGMKMVDQQSVGAYAAMIAEPVLSAAGIIELPPAYLKRLKELCDERGLLLIFDEAQTGLGRLGQNFAFEGYELTPDFLTLSKTLGGGLPLATAVCSAEIEESCYEKGFIYVTSHVSDPLCAAVGLATLEILTRDSMASRANEMGTYLKEQLTALMNLHECIGDVRGKGLLLGMEIVKERKSKQPDPELGYRISEECLRLGLSMNIVRVKGFGGVFRIAPPLTVTKDEIDLGVSILDQAICNCTQ
ncbi:aspartate aminotransferase family protein [Lewinella cohaerens]|uniref:aspartate aminotransferase family protein n=1 Tax=Lewinella cohaerens TaxID=70995 RepID=UPI0003760DCF|nr:aspartate aminotransferase family protein [Lewinella cohaerens]